MANSYKYEYLFVRFSTICIRVSDFKFMGGILQIMVHCCTIHIVQISHVLKKLWFSVRSSWRECVFFHHICLCLVLSVSHQPFNLCQCLSVSTPNLTRLLINDSYVQKEYSITVRSRPCHWPLSSTPKWFSKTQSPRPASQALRQFQHNRFGVSYRTVRGDCCSLYDLVMIFIPSSKLLSISPLEEL